MCGNCAGVAGAYSINLQHKFYCISVGVYEEERESESERARLQLALSADDGSQKGSTGPTQLVVAASGKLMHFSAATTVTQAATQAATK